MVNFPLAQANKYNIEYWRRFLWRDTSKQNDRYVVPCYDIKSCNNKRPVYQKY